MPQQNYESLTAALRQWQNFNETYHRVGVQAVLSWEAARRLVLSAEALDLHARLHLKEALIQSDSKLAPLCDPLRLDSRGHRWLARDREELTVTGSHGFSNNAVRQTSCRYSEFTTSALLA